MSQLHRSLKRSISQSGLLFQQHPGNGWKSTRPGAYAGEVAAYKHEKGNFHRLSLLYFGEGETDENGYTYPSDAYIIESIDGESEYDWEAEQYPTLDDAIDRLVEIMEHVEDTRQ